MKHFIDSKLFDAAPNEDIVFSWTTLFHYLNLESIFDAFPKFDSTSCLEALSAPADTTAIYDLYDNLFKECLIQVKTLEQVDPDFLIEKIRIAKENAPESFRKVLEQFEFSFIHDPQNTMHSLTLYLSWDRFCICLARIFDHQTTNPIFLSHLEILKDCVIESFHHIKQHGRTTPSFVRLMEALFFYEMREERLQTHSEEDWKILNHGFSIFNAPEKLSDFPHTNVGSAPEMGYFTSASKEKIQGDLALTDYFIRRAREQFPEWSFDRSFVSIIHHTDI